MAWTFTKENKEFWLFYGKNKENIVEKVKKKIEEGIFSKDLCLLKRDDGLVDEKGEYYGFYLLDELSESDDYYGLLEYLLSITETKPSEKVLERALHQAVAHGALINAILLVLNGAVPNKETLALPTLTGDIDMFDYLSGKFPLKEIKKYLLQETDKILENNLSFEPENTKYIKDKIMKL